MRDTRCIFLLAIRCVLKHFDAKLNFYYHLLHDDGLTDDIYLCICICVCLFDRLSCCYVGWLVGWLVVFLRRNILHVFETINQNVDSIIDIRMIELNC